MLATATKITWRDVLVRIAAGEPVSGAELSSLPGYDSVHQLDPCDYYVIGDAEVFSVLLFACSTVAEAFGEDHGTWIDRAVTFDEALVEACPDRFGQFPALRLFANELGMQADFAAGLSGVE